MSQGVDFGPELERLREFKSELESEILTISLRLEQLESHIEGLREEIEEKRGSLDECEKTAELPDGRLIEKLVEDLL